MLSLLFLVVFCFSCEKDRDIEMDSNNPLLGYWVDASWTEDNITFKRAGSLPEHDYGLQFKSTGQIIERKNSGSCGTPPIMYADYNGNWSQDSSHLSINVGYWGGMAEYEWEIETVNNTRLIVKQIDANYLTP